MKFRSCAFTGGHRVSNHIKTLKEGVDIAVCTPGRLFQLRSKNNLRLDQCMVCSLFPRLCIHVCFLICLVCPWKAGRLCFSLVGVARLDDFTPWSSTCVLQQRQGLSPGLASSVSSSKTATLTRSWKDTCVCYSSDVALQHSNGWQGD